MSEQTQDQTTVLQDIVISDSVAVVTGLNFANSSHYVCAFGGARVPASFDDTRGEPTIFCLTPPMPRGLAAVEVSLNGQQFVPSGANLTWV